MGYAIIKTGGKQYKVTEGQILSVEKLDGDLGSQLSFDQVLMVANEKGTNVGQPLISGAKVQAKIVDQGKGKKVTMVKFKRRKHSMKWQGHRQHFTKVEITAIEA